MTPDDTLITEAQEWAQEWANDSTLPAGMRLTAIDLLLTRREEHTVLCDFLVVKVSGRLEESAEPWSQVFELDVMKACGDRTLLRSFMRQALDGSMLRIQRAALVAGERVAPDGRPSA